MKTIILFFLGASIGSFLGLVIDRFPEQSIIAPSSHCNACKRRLKAWDLIPVLSQLSTKSKCRYCKAKIPYWYLGLEFLAGLVVLLCHFQTQVYSLRTTPISFKYSYHSVHLNRVFLDFFVIIEGILEFNSIKIIGAPS